MATLLKLHISGIRSFGPFEDQVQQLTFDTPVTLLVGQNGCGKTTILEAIKYACTGELPGGTSKGQGFVHDPKISDKSITKGQIKLKLRDVRGDMYTISKSVQLQQKAASLNFTTLDLAISILRTTGEKQQITGRCTDIDKQIAQVLQVSPCILNNVLFCHQENSSWPLEEGKKVKEKFDEIFDSKKYNKCGEILTKLLKTKQDKIKTLKLEADIRKERKVEVGRKREKLQDKKNKCDTIMKDMNQKKSSLDPHKERLKEIEALENDLGVLERNLTTKISEKKGIEQQQEMIKEKITDLFQGSEEQLRVEISSFENTQKEKEEVISTLVNNQADIELKEKNVDGDIQRAQIKLGQLREEKKQFETKCSELTSLFEKSKIDLEMGDNFLCTTPEESTSAIKELKIKLKEVDKDLEDLVKSKQKVESDLQGKIDKSRESVATTKQKLEAASSEIRKTDDKMLQTRNEIQELDMANNKLEEIAKKIEELSKTLNILQGKYNEENAEKEIINNKNEIVQMETKLEELERLHKLLQENYVIEEKLNSEESMLVKKKTASNKIRNNRANDLKYIFTDNIPTDDISKKLKILMITGESEMKKINTEITNVQKEITKLETQIQHHSEDIKKLEEELESKQSEIKSTCQGKDFPIFLQETHDRKEKLQKEKGQYSSGKIMYEKFIELFREDKARCPICETDFSGKKLIVQGVIEKLKQKIKKIPEKLLNTEKALTKEEKIYNKLQQLKPTYESIEIISNMKLPLMYEQLESNKTNFSSLNAQMSKLNDDLKIPTKTVEICRNIISDITLLDQYNSDIKLCEDKIRSLQKQKKNIDSSKNKHEVESEIEILKTDLGTKRRSSDAVRQKLDQHRQRCQNIKEDKNKQLELQIKYQAQANKKPHLEEQLQELRDRYELLFVEKQELQYELEKLNVTLQSLISDKTKLSSQNMQVISETRSEVNKKHKLVDAIIKLNSEITQYLNRMSESNLQQIIEQVSQLETKKKELSDVRNKLIKKITEQKEEIAKQITTLRNYQDNLTLREKKKEELLISEEIKKLTERIGKYNYKSVYEEKIKLRRTIETVERDVNSLKGQEMELKNSISDIELDLNSEVNKNADKNFKEKFYELKLTEALVEDLRLYIKALQHSILQFHKERMVLINERIRELWRNIYKGNDIDYIQINAEESKVGGNRQTYDYKVVQVKNGIELEMRGRCSAGQRVLACLIIRMALAESFSSHCGILALDEPTTNLDKENVTSLTYAISNIITSHENDNNFQLIVITHDQDFLDILRHSVQNISHYWRIGRNQQGYSIINKERL